MGVRVVGVVVVVVALSGLAEGLYFHIGETERKCFIEEIPEETMVTGNYKLQLYDPRTGGFMPSSPGLGMHVEIRDPDDKVLLSRVYSSVGRFTFTSHIPGEHVICLYSNSTKWSSGSELSVHFDIQVGARAVDYASVAQKEKLTRVQLRVRQLLDQLEQITKEQYYQMYRENLFRQTSESTNQQVLWWSVGQVLILLGMGFWQMRLLQSYSRIASEIRYHLMRPETRYPVGAGIGSQVFLDWVLENYSNDNGSPVGSAPPTKGSVDVNED